MKRTIHLAGNSKSAKMLSSSETSYEDLDTSIREQVQQAVVRSVYWLIIILVSGV